MRKHENNASLLELVFEGRNQSYGAYVLRRDYSQRMGTALGIMFSGVLGIFIWYQVKGNPEVTGPVPRTEREWMKISEVNLLTPKPPEPAPLPPTAKRPSTAVATQKFTSTIDIKPNVTDPMPSADDLKTAVVSTHTQTGKDPGQIQRPVEPVSGNGDGSGEANPFSADERQPEFPGGSLALRNFLAAHLQTPESLEEGERRMVRVRFTVLPDGRVDQFIIDASGGAEFDREVIRVCKRMPRWVPGFQNGRFVSVQYVLPVTFLSAGS